MGVPPHIPASLSFTLKASGGRLNVLSTMIEVFEPNSHNPTRITAIWDTGATGTAITTSVVNTLGLIPTGVKQVHTANGVVNQNTYLVNIALPNKVLISGITVTEITALSGGCDALIGMDIIGFGDFSITNLGGITCMSFRIPSLHEIDYVNNPGLSVNTPQSPIQGGVKPHRNDLCPCGSKKKYKLCHGKNS